jgi:hypothetical protein
MTPFSFGPTPYNYAGGFWPGMSIAQDPVTGQTFWTYTPVGGAPPAIDTPTRGQRDQQQWYPGA